MTKTKNPRINVVSDGTGETAASMINAAMVQFPSVKVDYKRFQNVRDERQIEAILEGASTTRDLVAFTIVSPTLRHHMIRLSKRFSIPAIDLMGPLLGALETYFSSEPKLEAGILHDVNETYFKRIEAMEYTIAHDDGRDLRGLDQADLIILGISRTSKTPLSMYLSHQAGKFAIFPSFKALLFLKKFMKWINVESSV